MPACAIPYLVGNTFDRDHPMWPTILRSEIELRTGITDPIVIDRTWPVDIVLAQFMAIAWRIKTWRIAGTAGASFKATDTDTSLEDNYVLTTTLDTTQMHVFNGATNAIATIERDLISFDFGEPYHALGNSGTFVDFATPMASHWSVVRNAGSPVTGTTNLFANAPMQFFQQLYALFDPGTKVFSPSVSFDGYPIGGPTTVAPAFLRMQGAKHPQTVSSGHVSPLRAPGSLHVVPGVIADSFDVPFEVQYGLPILGPSIVFSNGVAAAEFTITAVEFWPFSNTLGQPVYDETTGAQINNPFA